jgi:sec-independent protein translocase protein TatC
MAKKLKRNVVLDHLEELRWLLVRSIAILILQPLLFCEWLHLWRDHFGPTNANFVTYRFFCDLSNHWVLLKVFVWQTCLSSFKIPIWRAKLTFWFGLVSLPDLFWFSIYPLEVWKFISPALYEKKKHARLLLSPSLLFFFRSIVWLFCHCTHVCELFCYIHR